ncbi:MAG: bifunctional phosphopantothenoylcysteine decarboxylase/phosphopantothenate--cysteine ligase CoaBC [Phycisphaerae bacterium]
MTATKKNILVCVCGGIAAYKVCHVVSQLAQRQFNVDVAMTNGAQKFVGPLTFETLSRRPVHTDLWNNPSDSDPQHIKLAQNADVILVAPATANMIGKIAHGLADDLVSTVLLAAAPEKLMVAPSMNEQMWNNPAVQANIALLRSRGLAIIGPESGWQACRTVGTGRMSEPDSIIQAMLPRLTVQ